jgi:PAS domain S-box-containing protein
VSIASPLDAGPIATLVVRDGIVTYANPAALALLGLPRERVVGRPHVELVAPEDAPIVADRYRRRVRGEAAPDIYEVSLGQGARRRTVQVHAATSGADTVAQFVDVTADVMRHHRQDALNRVAEGAATAADLPAFLDRATEDVVGAVAADAAAVLRVDRDQGAAKLLHVHGRDPAARALMAGIPAHGAPIWAVALDGTPFVRHARELPEPLRSGVTWLGFATIAAVPLRYRSSIVGVLAVAFREQRDDAACGLDLLQAMGAHFAAAIETHRLLGDLRGRVAELTLLNDIALATATLDPVLLVENALRRIAATFHADAAAAYVGEGGELVQVAAIGVSPETAARAARLTPGVGAAGAAFTQRRTLHFPDVTQAGEVFAWVAQKEGLRCGVAVPLLVKDRALGALVLGRRRPEPFTDAELALLSAIGVQLAVAVENARLFDDTRRRVGDLEAVNSLALRVFGSAPGDATGLLEATCKEIARALSARSAVVLELDEPAAALRGIAGFGTTSPPRDLTVPLARSELAARALRTQEPVWGLQLLDEAAAGEPVPPPLSVLLVPLTSRGATRGVVAVADGPQRRFNDAEIALAYALASEAAMGLENATLYAHSLAVARENARLLEETSRRAEELGLLLELGRALVATLELDEVLDAGVRNLARIVDAPIAALSLPEPASGQLVIRAQSGTAAEIVGTRLAEDSLTAAAYAQREPVAIEDMLVERRGDPSLTARLGARAVLAVPLVVRDRAIGSAVIVDPRGARRFTPGEVERAAAVANQLAVAVEHARLYEDLRRSYAELARAQDHIVRQERLAALGELAAVVAHEVRNPLGVIFNSLGSLRRMLQPAGDAKMLLDIVGEESDRLNRIVGDLLDFAKPSPPALRPERLDRVIDEALSAALADGAGRVALARDVPDDLPAVPMDARLVRQVLLNLTLNAVQAMAQGGTLSVRARVDGAAARIEIGDTGPGIAEEVRHRIFEPFFTTKATGTGLGLAVVKRIVDDHHGALEVLSAPGEGTTFVIRLPLDVAPVENGSRVG